MPPAAFCCIFTQSPFIVLDMHKILIFVPTGIAAFLLGYSEQPGNVLPEIQERSALDRLSQAEANVRKSRVSDIAYTLDIDLIGLDDAYQGSVGIQFQMRDDYLPLQVDFTDGRVLSVVANGESIEPNYKDFFITLPASALLPGPNHIVIDYPHSYDQDGTGLHRFVNPSDAGCIAVIGAEPALPNLTIKQVGVTRNSFCTVAAQASLSVC